jgi:MFS family permease
LFLMSILLYRNYFYPSSSAVAEAHFVTLATVSAVGYACAALITPPVTRRLAKPAWIAVLLAASAVVTGALGQSFDQIAYLVIGFGLNLAGQGVAICSTTILQEEVDDTYRGRVFAFYDMTFNVTYVAGAALSAAFMPLTGRSPVIIGLVAVGYAVTAAGYWLLSRQPSAGGQPQTSGPPETSGPESAGPESPGPETSRPSPSAQASSS